MDYNWNWHVLLQPVLTGEDATYLQWIFSGFAITFALTVCAWILALASGTLFGILRTLPGAYHALSAPPTSPSFATSR